MTLILGIGFRETAPMASLNEVITRVLNGRGTPKLIATLDRKAKADQCKFIARDLNVEIIALSEDAIRGVDTPTKSDAIQIHFGTGSIAEACAIMAMPNAKIITPRITSQDGTATAALAYLETNT